MSYAQPAAEAAEPTGSRLAYLSHRLQLPCYTWDIPSPYIGRAFAGTPQNWIEFDTRRVTSYVAQGLRGKTITPARAVAIFAVAHEQGHLYGRQPTSEQRANTWARNHWNLVAFYQLQGTRAQPRQAYDMIFDAAGKVRTSRNLNFGKL